MLSAFLIFASIPTGQAQATPEAPVEALVCKRIQEDSTGSRLGAARRVCKTQIEWRTADDETHRAIVDTRDKGLFDPTAKPGGRGAGCTFAAVTKGRC